MLASENEIINEATQTMRTLSADEKIRLQCEAREEYNRTMNHFRNVEKMINCGDPSYGGAVYGCPHCGELSICIKFKNLCLKGSLRCASF